METEFLYYLLKASGIFIVLYVFYVVCFSRLTFHRLNRGFLIAMLPLSLVIPVINIGITTPVMLPKTKLSPMFNDLGEIGISAQSNVGNGIGWNIWNICFLIYCVVVLFFVVKLILNIVRIIQLKRFSIIATDGKYSILTANVNAVFSCFNWIFVPQKQDGADASIIEHEKLHGKMHHTLDLIMLELFIAFFWFNPFVYLFRKSLKFVHEFQTDSLFLKNNHKTSEYLRLLLNSLDYSVNSTTFCNNFNGSTLKKRIQMMTKKKSSKRTVLRYLLLLPFITLLMMSFSVKKNNNGEIPSISPIKSGYENRVSSPYGMRIHPITKKEKFHIGVDFAAQTGTPVVATADGIVTRVVFLKDNYGKLVEIDHGKGFATRYAQLNDFAVKENDRVKKGNVIGYVGQTGLSNGPHLHYEVLKDGKNVNPADYIYEQK